MQDLPRHLGQHSGGMVICQGQLNRVVPLERASMPGRTVVQWDKEDCADLGLVKIDLLGLGMMAVMKDCLDLIPAHYGDPVDLAQLPEDDPEVYDTLCRADTVGMFQVESRAQMASIPRNAPRRFYDLVVQVAIIRPGPIVGKMMHPYMRRRQKQEDVTYSVPRSSPCSSARSAFPSFRSSSCAWPWSSATSPAPKPKSSAKPSACAAPGKRMGELMVKLRDGMAANNITAETQEVIVGSIQSFALYGFPESHAASFALIAYASAYFKVKYLAAFTCAMLNNQPMGFYTPAVIVKDAQRHEPARAPRRRAGLRNRLHRRARTRQSLSCGWASTTPAASRPPPPSTRRPPARRRPLPIDGRPRPRVPHSTAATSRSSPASARSTRSGIAHRRDAIWQVEQISRPIGPLLRHRLTRTRTASPLRRMATDERLVADYAGTGLTTGPHPMAYRRAELRRQALLSARELLEQPDGRYVTAAGAVIARQRPGTALGFIFLSMEDETGIANIIIHPDLYDRERLLVTRGKFLKVHGKLQNQDGVIHVKAQALELLHAEDLELHSHDFH